MDWFRMYSEFASDPKVQSMSEAMQRRLMMLFCLRCSNTLVTLHETEIAFALRITDEELAETKALFLRKKFINEGWEIENWDKRQFRSDSSAERVARHRERKKAEVNEACNVTVTPQIQNRTDTEQIQNREEKKKARATRLPQDWQPNESEIDYCRTERPDLNPQRVAENFRDYWHGSGKVKADWSATWRTWVRNEKAQPRASPGYKSATDKSKEIADALTGRTGNESRIIDIN